MTTKEFIKRVEELGFLVKPGAKNTVIYTLDYEKVVAVVGSVEPMIVENDCSGWRYYGSLELFNLMYEYAKTPIADREEQKKYRLRAEGAPEGWNYLNRTPHVISANDYELPLLIITRIYLENQTSFTEKEIAELPAWCQALERIEVKE